MNGQVLVFHLDLTILDAINALAEHNIYCAVLWDETRKDFVDLFTIRDIMEILTFMTDELEARYPGQVQSLPANDQKFVHEFVRLLYEHATQMHECPMPASVPPSTPSPVPVAGPPIREATSEGATATATADQKVSGNEGAKMKEAQESEAAKGGKEDVLGEQAKEMKEAKQNKEDETTRGYEILYSLLKCIKLRNWAQISSHLVLLLSHFADTLQTQRPPTQIPPRLFAGGVCGHEEQGDPQTGDNRGGREEGVDAVWDYNARYDHELYHR